jgi:hemerythrin-like domain-containing protein
MAYRLPDPSSYSDPIRYFRDSHGAITAAVDALAKVVEEAEKVGIKNYFTSHPEVRELIYFFTHLAHIHERDEERHFFPVLRGKVSTMGFQRPDTTPAFLVKEHEELNHKARIIAKAWSEFLASGSSDIQNEQLALQSAKDLVALYREHIADENNLIYKIANDDLLTPAERIVIMAAIQDEHDEEIVTPIFDFDSPDYSLPNMSDADDSDDDEDE